jgi:hypothetical protein
LKSALEADESIQVMSTGLEIRALDSPRVLALVDRLANVVREAAAANGGEVVVVREKFCPEVLPSRVLARRLKSFADAGGMRQDPLRRTTPGEPSPWGRVSHDVAFATARYPTTAGDTHAFETALMIAKAVAETGLDVLGDMEFRGFVDGERVRALSERGLPGSHRRWLGVHPVQPGEGGARRSVTVSDVIVRGPGLPEPTLEDLRDDEAS